jgi:iron-sulfur cluster assembly protein
VDETSQGRRSWISIQGPAAFILQHPWDLTLGYDTVVSSGKRPTSKLHSREETTMAVSLSESAAKEVKKIIADQNLPEDTVLRVGVQGGGCSGFAYSLNFDSATSERDRIVEFFGVKMAVDKKFDPYLDGTVVDFYDGLEKRGFVFNNPNVVKSCGCGSSFQV